MNKLHNIDTTMPFTACIDETNSAKCFCIITVAMVGELGKLFKLYIATGSSHTFNKNELSAQQHN